jgi:Transglutaminase-like superfamily
MKSIIGWTTLSLWSSCSSHYSTRTSIASALCVSEDVEEERRSNQTHIVWHATAAAVEDDDEDDDDPSLGPTMMVRPKIPTSRCLVQTMEDAKQEAYQYLRDNMMSLDRQYMATLGFHDDDAATTNTTDGLANGLVQQVVNVSLQAKIDFPYTDVLPISVWQQYVLNYSHLNEGRGNVRRLLRDRLIEPLLLLLSNNSTTTTNNRSLAETVLLINQHMWKILAPAACGGATIRFVSGQTPAIFDPMSVLAFGYASCTGTSILFCEALRAAGIPARVAGTAAWHGQIANGNHNWVEVYDHSAHGGDGGKGEWKFLEPSPGLDRADSINDDPCSRWFCHPQQQMGNGTMVYAAALERTMHDGDDDDDGLLYFPLAWQWDCRAVPAINRTEYYRSVCSSCCGRGEEEETNGRHDGVSSSTSQS